MWGLVRAFQGKFPTSTNIPNDPASDGLVSMKKELIGSNIEIVTPVMKECEDEFDPYNLPFTKEEFDSALAETKADSSPGMDLISKKF